MSWLVIAGNVSLHSSFQNVFSWCLIFVDGNIYLPMACIVFENRGWIRIAGAEPSLPRLCEPGQSETIFFVSVCCSFAIAMVAGGLGTARIFQIDFSYLYNEVYIFLYINDTVDPSIWIPSVNLLQLHLILPKNRWWFQWLFLAGCSSTDTNIFTKR